MVGLGGPHHDGMPFITDLFYEECVSMLLVQVELKNDFVVQFTVGGGLLIDEQLVVAH